MASVTVGEELRGIFRDHDAGLISTAEFQKRKKLLLDWSRCHLMRRLPRNMRIR